MPQPAVPPRCWPIGQWPDLDQEAWRLGCTPGDPFDEPGHGASLRPGSLAKILKGYGRWLDFLASRGWLVPSDPPLARVTRPRLRAYFHALRCAGNADYTVIGRFSELQMAMKILAPGQDVSWIRRPDGVSVHAALPKAKRHLTAPDSGVLFKWGLEMMDRGAGTASEPMDPIVYRDGLLIAMLAARARRLRSMQLLRVGHELIRRGDVYRIELTAGQVKTRKPDRFDLPDTLTRYVDHYLAVVRPALLRGASHDAVWIGRRGGPLTAKAIQNQIFKCTGRRFGQCFGPHRFRHAGATTVALRDPGNPAAAAMLLGISAGVVEGHYNRADAVQATTTFDALIDRLRSAGSRSA